ncbi:hypothetical protein MSPP1_001201 [Malassezia sp. CBS 17886]|nr:hypothetical protein MSPP1_001201 [Malassezia sp. CBS 17886]
MPILKAQAALLSDFEVLQLLREAESEQREDARRAHEDDAEVDASVYTVPPNVRTIQFESFRSCAHQTAEQITAFLDALAARGYVVPDARILDGEPGLTKAERLQIVNHTPTSVVELHTRFSDEQINDILDCIATHFLPVAQAGGVEGVPVVDGVSVPKMEQDVAVAEAASMDNGADMDEDAFPEEHFEHEQPGAAGAEDDE